MKIRNIPFGYRYTDGAISVHTEEMQVITEIVQSYLSGDSLMTISDRLNERKVEYMDGVIGWNKGRLKRLIEDERYCGKKSFPSIFDEETFNTLQEIMQSKNVQKNTDRQSDVFQLNVPIICPKCHSEMRRKYDSRFKDKIKWQCKNDGCKAMILKNDGELMEDITKLLMFIISNPNVVDVPVEEEREMSADVRKVNSDINELMNAAELDKDILLNKLLEYASKKYGELDSRQSKAERLKDIFIESQQIAEFSIELFDRTVNEINLYENGEIGLVLLNNQEIRRDSNGIGGDSAGTEKG